MHSLLEGLIGVLFVMDDILIFGTTRQDTTTPGSAETSFLSWHYTQQ